MASKPDLSPEELARLEELKKTAVAVECAVCGEKGHMLHKHLSDAHGMSPQQYFEKHPGAPIASELGQFIIDRHAAKMKAQQDKPAAVMPETTPVFTWTESTGSCLDLFNGKGVGRDGTKNCDVKVFSGFTKAHGIVKVDPHYEFPEDMRYVIMAMEREGHGLVYTFGPTGSGKTSLWEQIAARTGRPFARIQIHAQMEWAELVGCYVFDGSGKMVFNHGLLPVMMQLPSIIVLDEFDSGNPVILAVLNAILEGKPLVIPQTREVIELHPDCKIVATGNTAGLGDDTGLYGSTSVMSFATMNRFRQFMKVDYLSAEKEVAMLRRRFPGILPETVETVVQFANLIRAGFMSGDLSVVMSTRQLIHWLDILSLTGELHVTYQRAFGNVLSGADKEAADNLFQRTFGDPSAPQYRRAA